MSNPKGNISTLKHFTGKWKSGKTGTIRVPVAMHEKLMSIARSLDEGNDISSLSCDNTKVEQAIAVLHSALPLKPNAGGAIKAKIKQALSLLETLVSRE